MDNGNNNKTAKEIKCFEEFVFEQFCAMQKKIDEHSYYWKKADKWIKELSEKVDAILEAIKKEAN